MRSLRFLAAIHHRSSVVVWCVSPVLEPPYMASNRELSSRTIPVIEADPVWPVCDRIEENDVLVKRSYFTKALMICLGLMGLSAAMPSVRAQRVFAWGDSHFGLNTVPAAATNAVAIAAGFSHNLVLGADGTVVAWGDSSQGQLTVPEEATNVVAIAAGSNHSLMLRADGRVFARGDDSYGQATVPANATAIELNVANTNLAAANWAGVTSVTPTPYQLAARR